MSDKRLDFLNEAIKHVGEGGSWTWSVSGLGSGPWCAAFVVAVGNTVGGVIGTVIYKTYYAGEMAELSYKNGMGTYQVGGHSGGNPTPAAGDLVTYNRGSPTSGTGVFAAQHIGIVYSVDGDNFTTVEGNSTGGKVTKHTYKTNSTDVAVFYRPDWAKAGGSSTGNPSGEMGSTVTAGGDLYDTITTRADSIIREVGYLDSSNKLSTSSSNLRCSVINYTTQLGSFFKGAIGTGETGGVYSANTSVSITGELSGNERAVMQELLNLGYTAAATAGICGNIYQESRFNPAAIGRSTHVTGYGLCQWSDDSRTSMRNGSNMIAWVGSDWKTNISKQIQYLDYQLMTDSYFRGLKDTMQGRPNTLQGAYQAMEDFLRRFEQPGNYSWEVPTRQPFTKRFWDSMTSLV